MGFSAGREGTDFLVPDVHSLDLALAPQRVCDAVETVADDAVDALYSGSNKRICKLISYGFRHFQTSLVVRLAFARPAAG
jgi:hypothetical protein